MPDLIEPEPLDLISIVAATALPLEEIGGVLYTTGIQTPEVF